MTWKWVLASLLISSDLALAQDGGRDVVLEPLGGIDSIYTPVILSIVKNWPPKDLSQKSSEQKTLLEIKCYETPQQPFYIGMQQVMWLRAKRDVVEKVLDDFDHYQDIFADFKDIHKVSSEKNKIWTYWEQGGPVFFMSNIKYKMIYLVSKSKTKAIYRYQLQEGNYLKYSDGVIVLEELEPGVTRYVEYDFWDGDWGIAKTLGLESKIWAENIKGNSLTDLAIKVKAENLDWNGGKVQAEAKNLLKEIHWEEAMEHKISPPPTK